MFALENGLNKVFKIISKICEAVKMSLHSFFPQ